MRDEVPSDIQTYRKQSYVKAQSRKAQLNKLLYATLDSFDMKAIRIRASPITGSPVDKLLIKLVDGFHDQGPWLRKD